MSGELYGAGLCVMTAEWIIISLSTSLSLFLFTIPLLGHFISLSPVAPLYPARKLTPASPFPCKDMQSRTAKLDVRERKRGREERERKEIKREREQERKSARENSPLSEASSRERCYQHGPESSRRVYERPGDRWIVARRVGGWREGKTRKKGNGNGRKGSTDIRRRKGSGGWSSAYMPRICTPTRQVHRHTYVRTYIYIYIHITYMHIHGRRRRIQHACTRAHTCASYVRRFYHPRNGRNRRGLSSYVAQHWPPSLEQAEWN